MKVDLKSLVVWQVQAHRPQKGTKAAAEIF